MNSAFMNVIARGVAEGGIRVARFEFPYMRDAAPGRTPARARSRAGPDAGLARGDCPTGRRGAAGHRRQVAWRPHREHGGGRSGSPRHWCAWATHSTRRASPSVSERNTWRASARPRSSFRALATPSGRAKTRRVIASPRRFESPGSRTETTPSSRGRPRAGRRRRTSPRRSSESASSFSSTVPRRRRRGGARPARPDSVAPAWRRERSSCIPRSASMSCPIQHEGTIVGSAA